MADVLTLLYHRVNPVLDSSYDISVTPENFLKQMQFLKSNYNIVRFEDDWSKKDGNAVCVTFDDGYADNFVYALPICEKLQIPITLFVSTGYIGGEKNFWSDELSYVLSLQKDYLDEFRLMDELYEYTWKTGSDHQRIELIKDILWLLKLEPDKSKYENWMTQLYDWANVERTSILDFRAMTKDELKSFMSSPLTTIGGHTVNHWSLGSQTQEQQRYEIEKSMDVLRSLSNEDVNTFSFPFGSNVHFNEDTLRICKECGIQKSATTIHGIWRPGDDLLKIPRVATHNFDEKEFKEFMDELGVKLSWNT